jgi:flagellar hook-associated protein FlgK
MILELRHDQVAAMHSIIARYRAERGEIASVNEMLNRALKMLREGKVVPLTRLEDFFEQLDADPSDSKDQIESAIIRRALDALLETFARLPVRLWEPFPPMSTEISGMGSKRPDL